MRSLVLAVLVFAVLTFSVEVTIITHPRGWIYVDGEPFFESPKTLDLSPGEHEIKVVGWGTEPTVEKVVVPSSGRLIVDIKPKLLKGWSRRVGVLVLQNDGRDGMAVSGMIAKKLREYNVDAFVVTFGKDSDSYGYLRHLWEVLTYPEKHTIDYMSLPYIADTFPGGLDFLIVGNFKILESSSGKTGVLRFRVYDTERRPPLACPPKVSEYDIYPAFPREYIRNMSSFYITGMSIGKDPMEMAEKAFEKTLPYLVEMIMGYSTWKGLKIEKIFLENSQETLDDFIWYIEKMYLMWR